MKLCYGTFVRVLRNCSYHPDETNDFHRTLAKSLGHDVCCSASSAQATNMLSCSVNVPTRTRNNSASWQAAAKKFIDNEKPMQEIIDYFRTRVIERLLQESILYYALAVYTLRKIIQNDYSISGDKRKQLTKMGQEIDLAEFLVEIFLYTIAICPTENTEGAEWLYDIEHNYTLKIVLLDHKDELHEIVNLLVGRHKGELHYVPSQLLYFVERHEKYESLSFRDKPFFDALDEELSKKKMFFICAEAEVGGMGKSTIAVEYCRGKARESFSHIYWIDVNENSKDIREDIMERTGFLNQLKLDKNNEENLQRHESQEDTINRRFKQFVQEKSWGDDILLVIDGCTELTQVGQIRTEIRNDLRECKILVTTRAYYLKGHSAYCLKLTKLHDYSCKELFCKFYFEEENKGFGQVSNLRKADHQALEELLERLNWHPFLIRAVAIIGAIGSIEAAGRYTIAKLNSLLEENGIIHVRLQTELSFEKYPDSISITEAICKLFKISGLKQEEQELLTLFSFLPSYGMPGMELLVWIAGNNQSDERKKQAEDLLNKLAGNGWIEKSQQYNEIFFKCHNLVQVAVQESKEYKTLDLSEYIERIADRLEQMMSENFEWVTLIERHAPDDIVKEFVCSSRADIYCGDSTEGLFTGIVNILTSCWVGDKGINIRKQSRFRFTLILLEFANLYFLSRDFTLFSIEELAKRLIDELNSAPPEEKTDEWNMQKLAALGAYARASNRFFSPEYGEWYNRREEKYKEYYDHARSLWKKSNDTYYSDMRCIIAEMIWAEFLINRSDGAGSSHRVVSLTEPLDILIELKDRVEDLAVSKGVFLRNEISPDGYMYMWDDIYCHILNHLRRNLFMLYREYRESNKGVIDKYFCQVGLDIKAVADSEYDWTLIEYIDDVLSSWSSDLLNGFMKKIHANEDP